MIDRHVVCVCGKETKQCAGCVGVCVGYAVRVGGHAVLV